MTQPSVIPEPFTKCNTIAPPVIDYRHHCVLLTLGLAPHSVAELWHATGIPVAELGPIVTQLFRDAYIRIIPRERAGVTRYTRAGRAQLVTPSPDVQIVEKES
jgi:hypothetical protein